MHHALEIDEILFNIFYCFQPCSGLYFNFKDQRKEVTSNLAALAKTCRAFKEPALDVLWSTIFDLSPLIRCLPGAAANAYSFSRPLTQTDWDILRSYTCRIQSIQNFTFELSHIQTSFGIFSNPPWAGPLFPNLRELRCAYTWTTMPLLCMPLPSLISLDIDYSNPQLLRHSLHSLPSFSPNLRTLYINTHQSQGMLSKITITHDICRWENLRTVHCPSFTLNADVLAHLSRMPGLTRLVFTLGATLQASDSPLIFSNLHDLTLYSYSLVPVSQFLSRIRLAVITDLMITIFSRSTRQGLSSFLASIQASSAGRNIQNLQLVQFPLSFVIPSRPLPILDLEDFRPFMAFRNIRDIDFNIECTVRLTDSDVLTLASSWHQLQHFRINKDWGWNSHANGLTPDGLLQLLQACRSLTKIAILLDTRGYTQSTPSKTPASLGLTLPPKFSINVLDSPIAAESVPALAAFLSGLAEACLDFRFKHWCCGLVVDPPNMEENRQRWCDVDRQRLKKCSEYDGFGGL